MKPRNRRLTTLWFVGGAALFLLAVTVAGLLLEERAMETDFSRQNLAPSLAAPFGTDWMGRDMLARTLAGLSLSIRIGLLTAAVSTGVALALGILSAVFGGWVDAFISWWIDLVMGIPHILLVILLSIACGRGFTGVVVGVALSHWTSLARVIALQEVIWMGESFMKGNSGIAGLVWPLFFTAVYYLIFSGIVTVLLGKLEKKLDFFQ